MLGNQILDKTSVPIDNAEKTRIVLDDLDSNSKYYFTVAAKTGGGEGLVQTAETNTRPSGGNYDKVDWLWLTSYVKSKTGHTAETITRPSGGNKDKVACPL